MAAPARKRRLPESLFLSPESCLPSIPADYVDDAGIVVSPNPAAGQDLGRHANSAGKPALLSPSVGEPSIPK